MKVDQLRLKRRCGSLLLNLQQTELFREVRLAHECGTLLNRIGRNAEIPLKSIGTSSIQAVVGAREVSLNASSYA